MDVSKDELDLGTSEEEKKEAEETEEEFKALTAWMKEVLGEQVEKVVVSQRLSDAPCILATSKFGWSANMERIMRAQAMGDNKAMEYMKGRKVSKALAYTHRGRVLQPQYTHLGRVLQPQYTHRAPIL